MDFGATDTIHLATIDCNRYPLEAAHWVARALFPVRLSGHSQEWLCYVHRHSLEWL